MLEIKFYIFKAINPDLAHQASEAVSEGGLVRIKLLDNVFCPVKEALKNGGINHMQYILSNAPHADITW